MSHEVVVYIGDRNTGKTTRLLEIFYRARKEKKRILVIDSATEHADKSLLVKLAHEEGAIKIDTCSKEKITFPHYKEHDFPYELIGEEEKALYLCDAAYYLEKGYDYPEGAQRQEQRRYYKCFSMQIIQSLLKKIDVIIMDEIELIPESKEIIQLIGKHHIQLFMTLRHIEGLCGLDEMFDIERI